MRPIPNSQEGRRYFDLLNTNSPFSRSPGHGEDMFGVSSAWGQESRAINQYLEVVWEKERESQCQFSELHLIFPSCLWIGEGINPKIERWKREEEDGANISTRWGVNNLVKIPKKVRLSKMEIFLFWVESLSFTSTVSRISQRRGERGVNQIRRMSASNMFIISIQRFMIYFLPSDPSSCYFNLHSHSYSRLFSRFSLLDIDSWPANKTLFAESFSWQKNKNVCCSSHFFSIHFAFSLLFLLNVPFCLPSLILFWTENLYTITQRKTIFDSFLFLLSYWFMIHSVCRCPNISPLINVHHTLSPFRFILFRILFPLHNSLIKIKYGIAKWMANWISNSSSLQSCCPLFPCYYSVVYFRVLVTVRRVFNMFVPSVHCLVFDQIDKKMRDGIRDRKLGWWHKPTKKSILVNLYRILHWSLSFVGSISLPSSPPSVNSLGEKEMESKGEIPLFVSDHSLVVAMERDALNGLKRGFTIKWCKTESIPFLSLYFSVSAPVSLFWN